MPHVLVVSYYFPPIGGTTVRRVLRFLRHLPKNGWRCTVVCADQPYHPFHPDDREELSTLPPVEAVLRAPARAWLEQGMTRGDSVRRWLSSRSNGSGKGGATLRRLLHETIAFPDPKWPWVRGAVHTALARARQDPYDVVFATGYPWSAFLVAERVSRGRGVPFVLDFRDAWTADPREIWHARRNQSLERKLIANAAAVTAATDWIRDRLRESCPEVSGERVLTLTNGFDPGELPEPAPELACSDRFVLTYTGTFNDALPPSPYDRTPYYLIEAITKLPPRLRAYLRVRIVGNLGKAYRGHIRRLGLEQVIEVIGSVPHRRSLQYQLASDALLLVIYDCPWANGDLTGKIFEYMGAGKPILALAPEGEASKLVCSHGLGWVEPPGDVEKIRARLAQLIESWQRGSLSLRATGVGEFSADVLTVRLADLLAEVRSSRGPLLVAATA